MHEDIISKEVPGGKVTPTGKRRKLGCINQTHNKACKLVSYNMHWRNKRKVTQMQKKHNFTMALMGNNM